jgi:hypothetical protein
VLLRQRHRDQRDGTTMNVIETARDVILWGVLLAILIEWRASRDV